MDVSFLSRRCPGGHTHVRVEGSYTKASAVYVDGLAWQIGLAFHQALSSLDAEERLGSAVDGLESVFANDVMSTSKWSVVRAWFWKRMHHINVLELTSAVSSTLRSVSLCQSSVRFVSFLDFSVCRDALAKGRSASYALQPGLRRAGAWCIGFDLYPAWPFSPTRLNVADDPTRGSETRPASVNSISTVDGFVHVASSLSGLRRFAANWVRLTLLAVSVLPAHSACLEDTCGVGLFDLLDFAAWVTAWIFGLSLGFVLLSWIFPSWTRQYNLAPKRSQLSSPLKSRPVFAIVFLLLMSATGEAMNMAPTILRLSDSVSSEMGSNL